MAFITMQEPTHGQFVAVWQYDGKVWSGTFKYNEQGRLLTYDSECVDWVYLGKAPAVPERATLLAYHVVA